MIEAQILNPKLPTMILGEGPVWDHVSQCLYWVDILGCAIHRYQFVEKRHDVFPTTQMIGFALPCSAGKMICGMKDGIYTYDLATREEILLSETLPNNVRFNDGKIDARGRLWAGTIALENESEPIAKLYCFNDRNLEEKKSGLSISNGLAWSSDNKRLYHAETGKDTIWRYDYDIETGNIFNQTVFIENIGSPDGIHIDKQGRLYIALFGSSKVAIYDLNGNYLNEIGLPVSQVTSCVTGGTDGQTVFITTASKGMDKAQLEKEKYAGAVFEARLE